MNAARQPTALTPIAKLKQQLRRQELALARLKNQRLHDQQNQDRLRLRLGNLLNIIDESDLPDQSIDQLAKQIVNQLQATEKLEKYRALGSELLRSHELKIAETRESMTPDSGQPIPAVDVLIANGDCFVKHHLHEYEIALVLGALISLKTKDS